ncbi:MAG: PTS sugar transporter subunit IIA, partial [Fusobacteriaceae bacterium]
MKITEMLTKETIELNLEAKTKSEVIDKMVDILFNAGKINNKEVFKEGILKRESQSSTGLEEGIAIPHAKNSAVLVPSIAFGMVKAGVDYESMDGEPSTLFFMIAAPENATDSHIDTLAKLTNLLLEDDFREKLVMAKTAEEVMTLIGEESKEGISVEKENTHE